MILYLKVNTSKVRGQVFVGEHVNDFFSGFKSPHLSATVKSCRRLPLWKIMYFPIGLNSIAKATTGFIPDFVRKLYKLSAGVFLTL